MKAHTDSILDVPENVFQHIKVIEGPEVHAYACKLVVRRMNMQASKS